MSDVEFEVYPDEVFEWQYTEAEVTPETATFVGIAATGKVDGILAMYVHMFSTAYNTRVVPVKRKGWNACDALLDMIRDIEDGEDVAEKKAVFNLYAADEGKTYGQVIFRYILERAGDERYKFKIAWKVVGVRGDEEEGVA